MEERIGAHEPATPASAPAEAQDVTILLAEDDRGHAELIRIQLREVGLRNPVARLRDGQAAWDFLAGAGPEPHRDPSHAYVLLLDLHMPKIDGVELLRRIKAERALATLPVIILSTTDNPVEKAECAHLGCTHFLTKPLDFARFAEALAALGFSLAICTVSAGRPAPELARAHA